MEHQIDAQRIHHNWDNRLEPTLRVASGDVVHYDILMAGHGQVIEGGGSSRPTSTSRPSTTCGTALDRGRAAGRHAAHRDPRR